MKKVLSYDPLTNTTQYFLSDGKGKQAIQTVQNVAPNLAENKEIKKHASSNWSGDMHHVARIPLAVYDAWWREFGGDPFSPKNKAKTIARLNSRDYLALRTKDGRI